MFCSNCGPVSTEQGLATSKCIQDIWKYTMSCGIAHCSVMLQWHLKLFEHDCDLLLPVHLEHLAAD